VPSRKSLLKILVTLAAIAALLLPAAIVFGAGWIRIHAPEDVNRRELTPIEAWVALALFYVFWAGVVMVGLVYVLDHIGYKFTPVDVPKREGRRKRRRRLAGLGYLRTQEAPMPIQTRRPGKKAARSNGGAPGDGAGRRPPSGDRTRPPQQGGQEGPQSPPPDPQQDRRRPPPPDERGAA
jgi:hypothetical protein